MITLKQIKKEFPERVTTSGNNYYIDGMGWYKQKKTYFGLETSKKNTDGSWTGINIEKLYSYMKQIYR